MFQWSFFSKGRISNIPVFGSGNGWAPIRRQAIIATNDGKFTDSQKRPQWVKNVLLEN